MEGSNIHRHSGKMGSALIALPLIAIPATLALAFIYGYVCVYNPLAGIVSFIIPLAYGGAICGILYGAAKASHCRNVPFVTTMAVICSLIAIYAGWASFLSVLLSRFTDDPVPGMFGIMTEPGNMWESINEINATGWFSIKNATPSGIILWIFWIVEIVMIAGLITLITPGMIAETLYCEKCGKWAKEKKNLARFAVPPMREDITRIKDGDLVKLAELGNDPGGQSPYLRLDTQTCEKCSETATFQVVHITRAMKDGKETESEEKWTKNVLLNPASLQSFQEALVRRAKAGQAPADPAATSNASPEPASPAK